MTSVAILGAGGRMGQMLVAGIARLKNLALAGALECEGFARLGEDAGLLAGVGRLGVPLTADFAAASAGADVLVDFSFHAATAAHARAAAAAGKPMVIGTTGLTPEEQDAIAGAAERVAVVRAPNMSLGVNVLFAMVRQAARILGPDYDVEIVETHHRRKKDAPSGTALALGREVAEGRGVDFARVAVFGREGQTGERPAGQLGIHAVRAGGVVGEHTVQFTSETESVQFRHSAASREAFAMGALRAAEWVVGRKPGLYTMQDVLGLAIPLRPVGFAGQVDDWRFSDGGGQ
ncbi:MAG: 4-hydroxy-tetrahydrodipicolinate reductase [Kiritimatiellae bacterium]|nr:4-hydroxy-tetrahydrodipicolinate reductase [Kiritimatiellia bacterium]